MTEQNKLCNKEIHAYQNENGTYRITIIERYSDKETKSEIECADISITSYATKDDNRMVSFIIKE